MNALIDSKDVDILTHEANICCYVWEKEKIMFFAPNYDENPVPEGKRQVFAGVRYVGDGGDEPWETRAKSEANNLIFAALKVLLGEGHVDNSCLRIELNFQVIDIPPEKAEEFVGLGSHSEALFKWGKSFTHMDREIANLILKPLEAGK